MLSRLVCRNGLHKHDLWEIIKSKRSHSCEAHTFLKHMGFAKLFQRIASFFGGNRASARQLDTNADAIFPMAENAAYQCMENGWGKHAQTDTFEAHCVRHVQF